MITITMAMINFFIRILPELGLRMSVSFILLKEYRYINDTFSNKNIKAIKSNTTTLLSKGSVIIEDKEILLQHNSLPAVGSALARHKKRKSYKFSPSA